MFSKSCKYALRAILFIAAHGSEDKKVGISEIASSLDVPQHFLGKLLQLLTRHKVLASTKGPGGGFYLTEANLNQSLLKVVDIIDGKGIFDSCILGLPYCSAKNPCPLHDKYVPCRDSMVTLLKDHTIKELALRVKEGGTTIRI